MRASASVFLSILVLASLPAMAKENPPIARINPETQEITVHKQVLKKTFPDGGEIERFEVVRSKFGPLLVRKGTDAKGVKVTAVTFLQRREREFHIAVDVVDQFVSYLCRNVSCEDGGHCHQDEDRPFFCHCGDNQGQCEMEFEVRELDDLLEIQGPLG